MTKTLFVGNIAYGAMEKEIAELFSKYGEVQEVKFIMDWQNGRFKGYGFVKMPTADADRAITKLDKYSFQDRRLMVSEARTKETEPGNGTYA